MKILTSRTNWTILAMFIIGGLTSIVPVLPADIGSFIQGVLAIVAVYFKMNPSQRYGTN